jgi:hypothetical protein
LKVKIRKLLTIAAILSLLLCGAVGTAYAVLGVDDYVPGQDLVVPFICGRNAGTTLNTLYTFAEVKGTDISHDPWVFTDRLLYNSRSASIIDFPTTFTARDLLSFDCVTDFTGQSETTKDFYTITVNGIQYLAGYVVLRQNSANDGVCTLHNIGAACASNLDCVDSGGIGVCDKTLQNRFIGWTYLVDLPKGFASGFDAISEEYGAGPNLGEDAGNAPVTAYTLYPRIYVHNDPATYPDTWNWWIILAGRNQLDCGVVTPFPGRELTGVICSPEEVCPSFSVLIPDELNVIDMMTQVPQVATIPGFPKSAFAIGDVVEQTAYLGMTVTLYGTINPGLCGNIFPAYSLYGWSYQRAESDQNAPSLSWDVAHPMHREYCTEGADSLTYIEGPECTYELHTP